MSNYYKTIHEAHDLLKNKEVSSVELTKEVFDRIKKVEPKVESFVTITEDHALEQAKAADIKISAGEMTPSRSSSWQQPRALPLNWIRS